MIWISGPMAQRQSRGLIDRDFLANGSAGQIIDHDHLAVL